MTSPRKWITSKDVSNKNKVHLYQISRCYRLSKYSLSKRASHITLFSLYVTFSRKRSISEDVNVKSLNPTLVYKDFDFDVNFLKRTGFFAICVHSLIVTLLGKAYTLKDVNVKNHVQMHLIFNVNVFQCYTVYSSISQKFKCYPINTRRRSDMAVTSSILIRRRIDGSSC